MIEPGAVQSPLDHVALFHRGHDELAERMGEPLARAVERREAVLVSLTPEASAPLRTALGPAAGAVRWLHADDRYATPAGAMTALRRFVDEAVGGGAPAVWSLGALAFDGSDRDAAWIRYEHAVNDVLADCPLHAVCAFDLDVTPASVLGHALAAHATHDGAPASVGPAPVAPPPVPARPSATPIPGRVVVEAPVVTPAAARSQVDGLAGAVPARVLDDVRLAVSELATNALRYGEPPAALTVWLGPDAVTVQVRDAGPGIRDPYADLRPPRRDGEGGRGLNIVAQLGHLTFAHDPGGAAVTVRLGVERGR